MTARSTVTNFQVMTIHLPLSQATELYTRSRRTPNAMAARGPVRQHGYPGVNYGGVGRHGFLCVSGG